MVPAACGDNGVMSVSKTTAVRATAASTALALVRACLP